MIKINVYFAKPEILAKSYNIFRRETKFLKQKEGDYTLCNGMDGNGEHYAK